MALAVAGMAYVGTKLMTDQKLAQRSATTKDNVAQLHNMIYSILQNKSHCTATFNDNSVNMTPSSSQNFVNITTSSGSIPFEVHTAGTPQMYMSNTLSINSIRLTKPADLAQVATLAITYGKHDSAIMDKRSGTGLGGKAQTRNISIKIQRSSSGVFEGCYAVEIGQNESLIENFCKELGSTPGDISNTDTLFVWDPVNNVCRPRDLSCSGGKIFAGFDSNGQKRCNTLENWMNLSNIVDNSVPPNCSSATSVGFEIVGSKVRIKCDGGAAGPCTTAPACPAPPGSNMALTYDSGFQSSIWGGALDTSKIEERWPQYANGTGDNCVMFFRNSLSCTSGFRRCIYSNSTNQGCTGANICGTVACPSNPGYDLTSSIDNPTWAGPSGDTQETDCDGVVATCKIHVRAATSCSNFKACYYAKSSSTCRSTTIGAAKNECIISGGTPAAFVTVDECAARKVADPSINCHDYTESGNCKAVVCEGAPKVADGVKCIWANSSPANGVEDCTRCLNQPTVINSMCCRGADGFNGLYQCGGTDMLECFNPADGATHSPLPSASAPPDWECDA